MSKFTRKSNKAIAFCRVATTEQSGQKLQAQKKEIGEYADYMNREVVQWFEQIGKEPITSPDSTLNQALNYCQSNPEIKFLIVEKHDRISRSILEFIFWEESFKHTGVTIKVTKDRWLLSPNDLFTKVNYDSMAEEVCYDCRMAKLKEAIQKEASEEGLGAAMTSSQLVKSH
jgi:DNA invertase Pin-like site-specific DNA recombinase